MNVIFTKDLKGQGKKGEVKEVKAGYAENFLIKNGYAVAANTSNMKHLNTENKKKALEEEALIQSCENMKKELEKLTLKFSVKTGAGDKVFGSVTPKQVVSELKKLGYDIDKKKITSKTPLTSLGYHNVPVELHKKVTANVKVHITKES